MRIAKPNPHPTQTAAPIHHLTGEPLACVLAALPPLLAHARPEWHRSRQRKISKEIDAFHPVNAQQAHLAGQIVLFRHIAANELAWARLQTRSPEAVRQRGRGAASLMRAGDQMLHQLHLQQKRPLLPPNPPTPKPPAPPPPSKSARSNPLHPDPARRAPAAAVLPETRPSPRTRAAKPTRPTTPPTGATP
jgi:hypothetical protein